MTQVASLAEYGALHGVTKQAAAKWKTRGYLVTQGEMVDVEASDARMKGAGKGRFNSSTRAVRQRIREASTVNQERQPGRQPSTKSTTSGEVDAEVDAHLTDPGERAAVALLPITAYRIGSVAALIAHEHGVAVGTAERLRLQVATSAMEIVCMILDEAEIAPPPGETTWCDVALFNADKVSTVDWAKVAAQA